MFERRLKIVLALPLLFAVLFVGRLYDLQIVRGSQYAEKLESALIAPRQFLPPLRGRIVDRFGTVLAADAPAHDVTVHFGALSMNEAYLFRVGKRLQRDAGSNRSSLESPTETARRAITDLWITLSRASGESLGILRARRDRICRSVEHLRRYIWRRRRQQGFDEPLEKLRLKEQDEFHPILYDVSPEVRTWIELRLAALPFVRIEPSVRREVMDGAESLCHLIGRLGQVSAETIESDPLADDALAAYRPGDRAGISGVERLAEHMLRGKRGFEERTLDGTLRDHAVPIDGLDVQLSIDLDLQNRVARILTDAVAANPPSTGGSCVIIDVETREVLALVSVPTFAPNALRREYDRLRDDTRHVPLRFRAVYEEYQPGSILKPVALLAGLACGVTTPQRRVFCDGQFIHGSDKWHCWTHWRGMAGHGELCAEEAIQHSCNVYFYGLGQDVGARRLTDFYRAFIRGPRESATSKTDSGTGLIEERNGLIPTAGWMREHRHRRFRPADGRNYAIGQGEIQLTPLQAANIFATLADGRYRAPTLIANDGRRRPSYGIPRVSSSHWSVVRRGLFRCVNELGGTAHKYVCLDELEICGKTGSAQCVPRITKRRYTFAAGDNGKTVSVVAPTVEAAREALDLSAGAACVKREIVERWPPPDPKSGKIPTHAWFAGYAPYHQPRIALALVIEYGGGGGSAAGPAAQAVFRELLDSPRGYLSPRRRISVTSAR